MAFCLEALCEEALGGNALARIDSPFPFRSFGECIALGGCRDIRWMPCDLAGIVRGKQPVYFT